MFSGESSGFRLALKLVSSRSERRLRLELLLFKKCF